MKITQATFIWRFSRVYRFEVGQIILHVRPVCIVRSMYLYSLSTHNLVTPNYAKVKLQAVTRGWLARRLARVLLLVGGRRREVDEASGAWQYVWPYYLSSDTPAISSSYGRRGYGNVPSSIPEAEELFRSGYPPALLKTEILPSPRAAARRVETEGRKREARLALASLLLEDQRGGVVLGVPAVA